MAHVNNLTATQKSATQLPAKTSYLETVFIGEDHASDRI